MSALPMDLLRRLRESWPYGKTKEQPPPLSTNVAFALSIVFVVGYVAPFYLSPTTRPSATLSRDSPVVIKARVRTVLLSCAVSTAITVFILSTTARLPYNEIIHLLGLWPVSLSAITGPLMLWTILYAAPLYEYIVVEEAWRFYSSNPKVLLSRLSSPTGFRNYVAGPFTEELLFRSLLIPLNLLTPQVTAASTGLTGIHSRLVLFTTPLYFGVAHVHHLYESRLTHPHVPFGIALIQTLFQLCFTTVFGWYAAFIFLRTGSLWACVLTHSLCNWMGLPRVWGQVERPQRLQAMSNVAVPRPKAPVAMGPPRDEPGGSGSDEPTGRTRSSSYVRTRSQTRQAAVAYQQDTTLQNQQSPAWTFIYYVLLFAGIFGFYKGLWPLTDSSHQFSAI